MDRRAIVIGAGLAGAAACERLCARGWQVTLVERHAQAAMEASGNLAGIFMPLLSKDDNITSRLTRAAFLYALDTWERIGPITGERCGVLQLARDAEHANVQRQIAARRNYDPGFAEWLDADAASTKLGSPAPDGAWWFARGGWARPSSVCAAMLQASTGLTAHFGTGDVRWQRVDGQWQVTNLQGDLIAQAPVLVVANGAKSSEVAHLRLMRIRGQVSHLDASLVRALPFVLCREAYLTPPMNGIVCAGATYDTRSEPTLAQSCHDDNLAKLRSLLSDPTVAQGAPLAGRVGFRSVAPDRLPLVGALPDAEVAGRVEHLHQVARQSGLYGLLGYASRGLIWAPLAAELLAAMLEGEPPMLEPQLVRALDPARFLLAQRRRLPA